MPKLEYPVEFEGGLLGCRVKEEIQHNEPFLYVPYRLLISVGKTKKHRVLGSIITKHPECFSEDKEGHFESGDFMVLVLALMYEQQEGISSEWYDYMQTLPDVEELFNWKDSELEMLQDGATAIML